MITTKVPKGRCPKCDKWNMLNLWDFCLCSACNTMYEPKHVWQPPLVLDDNLNIIFTFGKHKGEPVIENLSYARWMLQTDFPTEVKEVIEAIMKGVTHGRS